LSLHEKNKKKSGRVDAPLVISSPLEIIGFYLYQVALDFTVLGDGTPPAPILFKRDPYLTEREDQQGEKSQNDRSMQCNELSESDSDGEDVTSQYSSLEDVNENSSGTPLSFFAYVIMIAHTLSISLLDEDYDIASTSTSQSKTNATKSTRKPNFTTQRKRNSKSIISLT